MFLFFPKQGLNHFHLMPMLLIHISDSNCMGQKNIVIGHVYQVRHDKGRTYYIARYVFIEHVCHNVS